MNNIESIKLSGNTKDCPRLRQSSAHGLRNSPRTTCRVSEFITFKAFTLSLFLLLIVVGTGVSTVYADIIGNGSFEEGIGGNSNGNWDSTNGAVRTTPGDGIYPVGFSNPPDGNFALLLTTQAQFTFQTEDGVKEGDLVSFTARAEAAHLAAANRGGRMKIEFKRLLPNGTDETIHTVTRTEISNGGAPDAAPGNGFPRFTVQGIAPPGTGRVVFVFDMTGANANFLIDDVSASINPAKLQVTASKQAVSAGDIVTIHTNFRNAHGADLTNVSFHGEIPDGFSVLPQSVRLNGVPTSFTEGSIAFPIGTIPANQAMNATFQMLATSAVTVGKNYSVIITLNNNDQLSETASIRLLVEGDPVFDEGTIIGKVFNDINGDTVQDEGEKGIPHVRLVTEEGIVIITDANGRYSLHGVKPGRHLVKIDGHTLPAETKFVSSEKVLVKTTPGILNKANFAVQLPESAVPEEFREALDVHVTQGLDTSRPRLGVTMEPELIRTGLGTLEKEPAFHFQINYADFIKHWFLEIRDETGMNVWTGFGISAPPAEVIWSGKTESGEMIGPGLYSYRFKVRDQKDNEDWTPLHFFRVVSKTEDAKESLDIEIPSVGEFNIFADGKQSIPLIAKPTLRVQGTTKPGYDITINDRPVEVDPESGAFHAEMYTSPGEKEIIVAALSPAGETTTFRQNVTVKDSIFFMVGLGEEELGAGIGSGNYAAAGNDGQYKDGFYHEGRLSYYFMGKIKGKFLIKSHYDTEDASSALFTNFDPDDYYPVYGDASVRNYEAVDSRQRFYIAVEMDRSFVKWGSFQTAFTDTELATYNRTLSGLKLHYETVGSTPYGDPKRGFTGFWTKAQHRADHNEFLATGGTSYYLRNRFAVEGSEKVRVEYRDKIQNIPLESYDLREGTDYEIDYEQGRITLAEPLSSVAAATTLTSSDLLASTVYLIVDYEFEGGQDLFENKNRGLRGYTHIGDHFKVGATMVQEKRQNVDYDLRGVDATVKIGRNTKVTAEYAETRHEQVNQSVSYNGGLSFAELASIPGEDEREDAWLIKAESKPLKGLDISGYIQNVEPGFSTDRTRSQEGFKKYGIASQYEFNDFVTIRYRFDKTQLVSQLRPTEERNISSTLEERSVHTVQAIYDDSRWLAQAEYQKRETDLPSPASLVHSLVSDLDFDQAVSGKLGYRVNERLMPYAKVQTTLDGKANHQFGGGVRYKVTDSVFAYLEQMIGNFGDSTLFGFEQVQAPGARSYLNLRMFDRGVGRKTLATAIGSSFSLSPKSRVYTEREHSTYDGQENFADIFGYQGKINDHWIFETRFERRHLDSDISGIFDNVANASLIRNNSSNVFTATVGYIQENKLKTRTSVEYRRDQDTPKLSDFVLRNYLEYQLNPDLSFQGKWDFGTTRFRDPDGTPAAFTELNVGFAYRPVDNDRLNILAKYSYMNDVPNDLQYSTSLFTGIPTDERSHTISMDFAYELHKYVGLVEKLAFRRSTFETPSSNELAINSFLWVNRLNFHVTRKWDVAMEYRLLSQSEAGDSLRHGALVEVDREFYDYVRLGLGYNFTDFDDDIRNSNDYRNHGPFVRLTGQF